MMDITDFFSLPNNSSSSATYDESFARHAAESARALDMCAMQRTSVPSHVKPQTSRRLFGVRVIARPGVASERNRILSIAGMADEFSNDASFDSISPRLLFGGGRAGQGSIISA